MFHALIVDDERIEREGIRFLIRKHGLPVDVAEAANGEKALTYLLENKVDILITDIKMPFMDGLQLAAKARELDRSLKIVILSAFGEFDYAKRAIPLQIAHYLLKPIEVSEFLDVMRQVIRHCEEDKAKAAEQEKLQSYQRQGVKYRKEKLLLDLIHGSDGSDRAVAKLAEVGWACGGAGGFRMAMLETEGRCFDAAGERVEAVLRDILPWPFDYLNLNEYQSVLFMNTENDSSSEEKLERIGARIQRAFAEQHGATTFIAFSPKIDRLDRIASACEEMEQALETRFFLKEPAVFLTGFRSAVEADEDFSQRLNQAVRDISAAIDGGDRSRVADRIEKLFQDLQGGPKLSSIYVKYICVEIAKLLIAKQDQKETFRIQQTAEHIFKAQHVEQLREIVTGIAGEEAPFDKDSARKAIEDVLHLIHREYRNDLGLETLAEKVYLSPNYLSRLFKKETGTSIVKYITAYRLNKASELLRLTHMKIVDISAEVGYSNFSYFCSIFRNYYGTTPAKYREGEET